MRASRLAGDAPVRAPLVAVCVLLGFLVVTSVTSIRGARRSAEGRREELVGLVQERQRALERLGSQATDLRRRVAAAEDAVASQASAAAARRRRVRLLAGLTPVEGPGLELVMRDSDAVTRDPANRRALRVIDTDLQLVTNALFDTGAEAVAVNDQRIVATTSIRGAGETITVNFRPLVPPYRIVAVGADAARFARSEVAQRFADWADLFGFGFDVSPRARVRVPAFTGSTRLSSARPGGQPSPGTVP